MGDREAGLGAEGKGRREIGLSTKILIGLLAGMGCSLFFGEYCAPLQALGDAFVGLLQMTVLTYITCSLTLNIGRLTPQRARRTFLVGGCVPFSLWPPMTEPWTHSLTTGSMDAGSRTRRPGGRSSAMCFTGLNDDRRRG